MTFTFSESPAQGGDAQKKEQVIAVEQSDQGLRDAEVAGGPRDESVQVITQHRLPCERVDQLLSQPV